MNNDIQDLVNVVDQLDPGALSAKDIEEIKKWGADNVGFILMDMTTQVILYATPGAEKIFGYMQDEMINLNITALVADEFQSVHPQHVAGFNEHPGPRSMGKRGSELYGKERDGVTFPVEIGLFPRKFKGRRVCLANVVRLSKLEKPTDAD